MSDHDEGWEKIHETMSEAIGSVTTTLHLNSVERAKSNAVAAIDLIIAQRDRLFIHISQTAKDLEHLRELMTEAGIIEPNELGT